MLDEGHIGAPLRIDGLFDRIKPRQKVMGMHRGGERHKHSPCAYPTQFFLTVEHAVEFTHVHCARPHHGQHLINIPLLHACTCTCTGSFREVLYVLILILRIPSASLEPPPLNYSLRLKLCSHQQNTLSPQTFPFHPHVLQNDHPVHQPHHAQQDEI